MQLACGGSPLRKGALTQNLRKGDQFNALSGGVGRVLVYDHIHFSGIALSGAEAFAFAVSLPRKMFPWNMLHLEQPTCNERTYRR